MVVAFGDALMVDAASVISRGLMRPGPSANGEFSAATSSSIMIVNIPAAATRPAWVRGVAVEVTTKISTRTNRPPPTSSPHIINGMSASAATNRVSRAVEMAPTWDARLVAVAECSAPVDGASSTPRDCTRFAKARSTSGAPPSARMAGQS